MCAGVDRDAVRGAGAGDEVLVGAGAVEVGAADRVRCRVVRPVDVAGVDRDADRVGWRR